MQTGDDSLVVRVNITQQELDDFRVLTIRRGTTVPWAMAALVRWALRRAAETGETQMRLAAEGETRPTGGNQ